MNGRSPDEEGLVTWAELMARLEAAKVAVGRRAIEQYVRLGLLPKPKARGRPGKGKGVDWGWAESEARRMVERVKMIKERLDNREATLNQLAAQRLRQAIERALRNEVTDTIEQEAWQEAYDKGYKDAVRDMKEPPTDEDPEAWQDLEGAGE